MFAPLARRDQRAKGGLYLRGLLLEGRRKSMQPMAERLGVDHQALQQFMTSSTWPVEDVRARLARCWSRTPPTARTRTSATVWRTGTWPTCCRRRAR
ncbi:transposase [Kitasatospora purpeofusca]|uniref:transposase n=1 Tax=Kitasatospora purpeofusca TaxID=67352 RepID=UPI003696AA39